MLRELTWSALLLVVIVTAVPAIAVAEPALDAQQVQADVEHLLRATYSGDVDSVLSFTHPSIIEMMGGREAAHSVTAQAFQHIARLGMNLESLSFPQAPEFLEGGGKDFAIVPTLILLTANGQKLESGNFQFGVRDKGSSAWHYIEGSRMTQDIAQRLFPGFPSEYHFPETYRRKL